jgi:hypothetical protein
MLAAGGWRVLAPCTRGGRCPALPSGTCHADVAWDPPPAVRRIGHAARIGRERLAFSYFLLEPPGDAPVAAARPSYRVVSDRFLSKSGRLGCCLRPEGSFRERPFPFLRPRFRSLSATTS